MEILFSKAFKVFAFEVADMVVRTARVKERSRSNLHIIALDNHLILAVVPVSTIFDKCC